MSQFEDIIQKWNYVVLMAREADTLEDLFEDIFYFDQCEFYPAYMFDEFFISSCVWSD